MVPWFRVQTQVFNADESAETVGTTGKPARIFIYRVVPYLVHQSKFQSSTDASPGITELKYHTNLIFIIKTLKLKNENSAESTLFILYIFHPCKLY